MIITTNRYVVQAEYAAISLLRSPRARPASTSRSRFAFDPSTLLKTALFVLVLTFLASVGPALSVSHMRIRELLRYE